ncbi:unnamed protein product [Nezara viridula]|uniref:Cysteine rich secreted protein n=1 Tax=Nezara viridula TaxID=85310 RepID=A0A9P0H857_NEZVI|nr:unnamed protein product [Nezara viridula]
MTIDIKSIFVMKIVVGENCSATTYCPDGYHCCTATTCCLYGYYCCGGGYYCCLTNDGLTKLPASSPNEIKI